MNEQSETVVSHLDLMMIDVERVKQGLKPIETELAAARRQESARLEWEAMLAADRDRRIAIEGAAS